MARDIQHQDLPYSLSQIPHFYGDNVHLVSSPICLSLLAKLGSPETKQPLINDLVSMLYGHMIDHVVDLLFPRKVVSQETRMKAHHPEASYEGQVIDPDIAAVCVDLARAGTLPSQVCYSKLNYLLNPDNVRQDHFYIARVSNEKGEVTGVSVAGSKIGGGVDKAIVLFPDPMGATGSTMVEAVGHYQNLPGGRAQKMVAMHLIVTPEYLAKVTKACPDLVIVALRLDRGLSEKNILNETPGKHWPEEKGLNSIQYIVPGAGGLGEILNNSYC
jgi:uracil phosphoribosyltransferase